MLDCLVVPRAPREFIAGPLTMLAGSTNRTAVGSELALLKMGETKVRGQCWAADRLCLLRLI